MSSVLNRIITSRKKSPSKAQTSTMKNIFKGSLANFRQSRARVGDINIELSTPRSATPISATPRSATPRGATPRGATPRGATPRSATPRGATPRGATPRGATPRSTTPSVRRPVPQEALDTLKTTLGESRDLQTLSSKRSNIQDEILKKNKQILLLEQKLGDAKKKVEKDEYERKIKTLKALKLALEQNLAEIKIELRSAIETIQKHSKKGGTRKRRKYAKKY